MNVAYRPIDWIDWIPKDRYRVGDDGSVWSFKKVRSRWKKMTLMDKGTSLQVSLTYHYRTKDFTVAALVLRAFAGPRPFGCMAFHFPDRDYRNNTLSNLRWVPKGMQALDNLHPRNWKFLVPYHGIGEDNTNAKLTEPLVIRARKYYENGWTFKDIADEFEVSSVAVREAVTGITWKHVDGSAIPSKRSRGGNNGSAKLTEDEIIIIRSKYREGVFQRSLAAEFGVSQATISKIVRRQSWAHIPGSETAGEAPD